MAFFLYAALNTLFVILTAPLFVSLIKIVKARLQGRQGPPLFQTYFMMSKLLRKENVYSTNTSVIMRLAPFVNIAFVLTASLFVPFVFIPAPVLGIGNVILFLYLLVCAKFFMALAGLDAGSTFGGMGSSREMNFSAIVEPVVIATLAALSLVMKTTNFHEMFAEAIQWSVFINPVALLIAPSLFLILIIETSRIPVDNPETHLELTMIHEAMILEYSGPNLALMEMTHAVKQMLLMGILINTLMPWGLTTTPSPTSIPLAMTMFLAKGAMLAIGIGFFESIVAKARLFRLPSLFVLAFFFSFSTILFELLT